MAQTVAPFKVPRTIVLVDEIPKGATGKLQRIGLHERLGVGPHESDPGDAAAATVPPRTYLERLVARVWCEVLGPPQDRRPRRLLRARRRLDPRSGDGRPDPRPHGPARPAARQHRARADRGLVLAARSSTAWSAPTRRSSRSRRSGEGRPLYLVHGVDGDVLGFAALARRLGEERPFYGLRARGVEGRWPLHRSIDEMASAYLDEVTHVQPAGPYLLGGLCAGGPVAIEMARQLQERGEPVAQVVLIDPRLRPERTPLLLRLAAPWSSLRRGQLWRVVARPAAAVRAAAGSDAAGVAADDAGDRRADRRPARRVRAPSARRRCGAADERGLRRPRRAAVGCGRRRSAGLRPFPFAGAHEHLFLPPAVDHLASALRAALDEDDA